MARFSGAVPPGGEGWITLRVNTSGYRGNVTKSARVFSNDPSNKIMTLSIRMTVQEAISLSQSRIYLKGEEGQHITESLVIEAKTGKPLELEPAPFDLKDKIDYKIEYIEKGKRYKITLTNKEGVTGSYKSKLKIKTNYPEKPQLVVYVFMNIRKTTDNKK